jgi:hypothetical protein
MPNPSGPDRDDPPEPPEPTDAAPTPEQDPDQQVTDTHPVADAEPATEVFVTDAETEPPTTAASQAPERRFTAPGFDAGATEVIHPVAEPATDVFHTAQPRPGKATPQLIPPRLARKLPSATARGWGWVLALVLIILALAAIAVLGTVWLTRDSTPAVSQEDQVRTTIHNYDAAVQNGDLTTLRTITCGTARDDYVNYNDQAWTDTYRRIAAAKQYPVIASIDQVVVNGEHAEANITGFMAYAPEVRSTRSLDLQFRDDQWKICQSSTG